MGQQRIDIQLKDTILMDGKLSFVSRSFKEDYGLLLQIDGSFYTPSAWKTFSIIPSHFFWSKQFDDELYHEVLFVLDAAQKEYQFFLGSSKDTVMTEVGILTDKGNNQIDITFIPKEESNKDTLRLSVSVAVNKHGEAVFFPKRIFKGAFALPDTVVNFQIWPYQTGPTISIDTGSELRLRAADVVYRIGEPFVIGKHLVRLEHFDYIN
ncbi:MAG: hypothetical protein R2795_13655 [Saprospiraceae bacterium]